MMLEYLMTKWKQCVLAIAMVIQLVASCGINIESGGGREEGGRGGVRYYLVHCISGLIVCMKLLDIYRCTLSMYVQCSFANGALRYALFISWTLVQSKVVLSTR